MNVTEVISLLENNGWELKRIKSHYRIFRKIDVKHPILLAGGSNDQLKAGTLERILAMIQRHN